MNMPDLGSPINPLPKQAAVPTRHPLSRYISEGAYPGAPESLRILVSSEDQLMDRLTSLRSNPPETFRDWLDRRGTALATGEDLPEDLAADAAQALEAQSRVNITHVALGGLAEEMRNHWARELDQHADDMLTGLAGELEEILAAVRAAADVLEGVDLTDAEAISEMTAKQRTALGTLKELRPRYRRLRHLQENLLTNAKQLPPDLRSWRSLFATGVHEFSAIEKYGAPSEDLPAALWFRRLLYRDDVWLPTRPQLAVHLARPEPERTDWTDRSPEGQDYLKAHDRGVNQFMAVQTLND